MKHNVSMFEYEKWHGGLKEYAEQRVALFDNTKINEKEVRKVMQENDDYHPDIIFCSKKQYLSVFSSLLNKKNVVDSEED